MKGQRQREEKRVNWWTQAIHSHLTRLPFVTLLFILLALQLMLSPQLAAVFDLQRALVLEGEFWRLLTGHLTHWGANHLLWDGLTFLVFGSYVELFVFQSRRQYIKALALGSLAISLGVCLLQPQLIIYRGLSGLCVLLFSIFVFDCLRTARASNDQLIQGLSLLLLSGLIAKILFEFLSGEAVFVSDTNFAVVPLAHVLGLLGAYSLNGKSTLYAAEMR